MKRVDFLKRHLYLRNRLLDQGNNKIRLIRSLKKFIFRYQDLVEKYYVDLAQAFPKKWWVKSDFTAPNLPLPLRLTGSGFHYGSIFNNTGTH
jgi:hypothetical protein